MSANPFPHEMIRASAGSGKTHQLTNRYLGLLAAGVEPDAILATTFTRKAAAEILDRVLDRLARAAGDAHEARQLAAQIQAKTTAQGDFVSLLRRLLQSLHRVRIGTLDSFYIALAGSFSFELGLPAGWSICEPADDDALQRDALERLLDQQPEDIANLFPLLSKGETKRSVQGELSEVIGAHYETFRGSERSAWECLTVPEQVAAEVRAAALEELRVFDLSACGHKNFIVARTKDVDNFEQGWPAFVASGLAARVQAKETTYYKKAIPQAAQALYQTLLEHARSEILRKLAQQTRATWDLLDRFHRELWTYKQATGMLRFWEVTQALVDALGRQRLRPESLAFRLDGAVHHLLLDEFQDTSLAQWRVLEPVARGIVRATAPPPRSFFCVGDVKQAIYGWRGGMAGIFNTLQDSLGHLEERRLDESRRSAQPIIDVVNQVFGSLGQFQAGDKNQGGLKAWSDRFVEHKTVKKEVPGYVCLHTGPAQQEGEKVGSQRKRHCEFVAKKIQDLVNQAPGFSIGVLCRKNDTVAQMIYQLRQLKVEASEEGGKALTDSPAVEIVLSLFTLADHPGHSIAWFHLKNSPLQERLQPFADPESLVQHFRQQLLADGYGKVTHDWAKSLAGVCSQRDLSRLQQLVEMAYAFQPRSTLRADAFVSWVRQQRVPDPSGASVRVMTIHGAKGLQFDVVVLPELDSGLTGLPPAFVVGRDTKSLDVNFVCRYADEATRSLLEDRERLAFEEDHQHRVEESLSLLYVAMTRAAHALHMYIPGPRKSEKRDAWYNLLRQSLAPTKEWSECTLLREEGNQSWFQGLNGEAARAVPPEPADRKPIAFKTGEPERRRGMDHVAPSRREGQSRVHLERLFKPSEGTGTAAGTLYHAWFETIAWLDDGLPTDESLRAAALRIRNNLPVETWRDLDGLLATFRAWLENEEVSAVLRRPAYSHPHHPGFPSALAPFWTKSMGPQKVERERRFLVRDGTQFWNGSFDRVVWLGEAGRTVAADVLDFKTDALPPDNAQALEDRMEHYRPQLEAYSRAVARLAQLPPERIATRLVFTNIGRVVSLGESW